MIIDVVELCFEKNSLIRMRMSKGQTTYKAIVSYFHEVETIRWSGKGQSITQGLEAKPVTVMMLMMVVIVKARGGGKILDSYFF